MIQRNAFVDEHDGYFIPYRVQIFAVLPDQTAVDFFFHFFTGPVFELPRLNTGVEGLDKRLFGQMHRLFGFRAGENIEQFLVNHDDLLKCGNG